MKTSDARVNLKRKGPVCLYCGENHRYDRCKHPDIINFSEYLVNVYQEIYKLPISLDNKYLAAYNLLSEYSINLLITAGRNASEFCKFKKTYGKKNLDKKDVITELSECMFSKYADPDLIEENVNKNVNKSFFQSFRNSIHSLLKNKNAPSAPSQADINLHETNYKDIHGPSAPPMMETGGKRRRTKRRLKKNKKTKRR